MQQPTLLRSILEIFGVVFLRFRPVPRVWAAVLTAVNGGALFFIDRIEAQVVLCAVIVAVVVQALTYQRLGFVRILGVSHALWIPMFLWMGARLPEIQAYPEMAAWLALLLVTNGISLIIDTIDMTRYLRGDRQPYYSF